MTNNEPPKAGATIVAHCNCANTNTTWVVIREKSSSMMPPFEYQYYWSCLNCNKKTLIGRWPIA